MQPAVGPSSSQIEVFANLDDLLECSICYTPFERPLQLSCGHSFCSNCIDRLCQHERGGDEFFGLGNFDDFGFPEIDDPELVRVFGPFEAGRHGLGGAQEPDGHRAGIGERNPWQFEANAPILRRLYPFRNNPLNNRFADLRRLHNERRVPIGVPDRRDVQIRCPECRRYTNVPAEGLPVNYRLQDMISRLNISKNKATVRKDFLKCGTCNESLQSSSFFTCKQDICVKPESAKLCPTCAIRNHNGHQIEEIKLLSEQDIADAKANISHHTARAHQSLEQIESGFAALATKAKDRLGNIVKDGMTVFASIANNLDNEVFTSLNSDEINLSIEKAKSIADQYEILMNTMNESVAAVDIKFAELGSQLIEFFKHTGFQVPTEKVKIEPIEENDVLVLDMERERQQQQLREERRRRDEAAQQEFMEMLRRHRVDERNREDRRHRGFQNDINGQQLMRRLRERQINIGDDHVRRMNARLERLHRHVRNEEPYNRPPGEAPPARRERLQDPPQAPIAQPNQNIIRDHGDQAPPPPPNVKMEVVSPPGSPARVEEQREQIDRYGEPARRPRRRRYPAVFAENDPNRPGPSNQGVAGEHGAPAIPEPRPEVNGSPEIMRKVPTEASSNEIV